jgi:hypothetical protein
MKSIENDRIPVRVNQNSKSPKMEKKKKNPEG